MFSNSRLSAAQKADRKAMLAQLPKGSALACDGVSLTILTVPDGAVTRVFSAVMSSDECKFRRKVGEFHALQRYFNDASGGLVLPGVCHADSLVDMLGTYEVMPADSW